MANDVKVRIGGDSKRLKAALGRSTKMLFNFKNVLIASFATLGVIKLVSSVSGLAKTLGSLYNEQEKNEAKLAAVINATGNAAGFSADQLATYAGRLQNVTTFGDEAIINAEAILATFKNVRGDEFLDATKAILDMSTVLDTDLKSSAIQVGKALNDPIRGVTALSEAGITFSDSQKELIRTLQESGDIVGAQSIILKELESQFGGAAEAAANTFGGKVQQAKNAIGDLGQKIFELVLPAMDRLVDGISRAVGFFGNLLNSNNAVVSSLQNVVSNGVNLLVDSVKFLVNGWIVSWTAIQVFLANWQKAIVLNLTFVGLAIVSTFNTAVHVLTVVIPTALKFFFDNWKDIFKTVVDFTKTVFINLKNNVTDFITSLINVLSGGEFDFEFTALTDGFETSIKEFPKIAERELGNTEKVLRDKTVRLASELASSFEEQLQKNREKLGLLGGDSSEASKDAKEGIVAAIKEVSPELKGATIETTVDDKKVESGRVNKKTEDQGTRFVDVFALNKTISAATGKSKEVEKLSTIAKEAKKQTDEAKKANDIGQETLDAIDGLKMGSTLV